MIKLAILGTALALITLAGIVHLIRAYRGRRYVECEIRAGLEDIAAGRVHEFKRGKDLL